MATIKTSSGRKRAPKKSTPKQKVRIIYREKECDKEHGSSGSGGFSPYDPITFYRFFNEEIGCSFYTIDLSRGEKKIVYDVSAYSDKISRFNAAYRDWGKFINAKINDNDKLEGDYQAEPDSEFKHIILNPEGPAYTF